MFLKRLYYFCFFSVLVFQANAQYFGQNKVQYERYAFRVLEIENFRIHYYMDNIPVISNFGQLAEQWYARHLLVFNDTLAKKNPVILYNNHGDFQQTTVIESLLSTGTSGVTEGFRNRVVMPYLQTNRETSHVLGHEMVHVFQYNLVKNDDSLMLSSIMNVPLWMIEGLSEYLSIGREDYFTSMWMRDAVADNDVPSLQDMTMKMNEYFPYRYGHAFWAFVGGLWGDQVIRPLTKNTAMLGYEKAIRYTLGVHPDTLSSKWRRMLITYYSPFIDTTKPVFGKQLFGSANAGETNISPVISPDGKSVIFLSDKDVISLDIFVGDVQSGKMSRKLFPFVQKTYIDEYKDLASVGSWSPDNNKFVLATFVKGQNRLLILDVQKQRIARRIKLPHLESFSSPQWSPHGDDIVFSGLNDGQSDLFIYNLSSGNVEQLTNDAYSDIHPSWSPDGKKILFVSDRGDDTKLDKFIYGSYKICIYDLEKKSIHIIPLFPGADNIDPHFSSDGTAMYFLSNADGFRNLYEYEFSTGHLFKLTEYHTGISGITALSPAISIARDTDIIVYNYYRHDKHTIYMARLSEFVRIPVDPLYTNFAAAILPPVENRSSNEFVTQNLKRNLVEKEITAIDLPYRPKMAVEYIGSTGVGIGVGQFETAMYGGVSFWFSDILKRNQIFTAAQVNGEVEDFGGAIYYMNSERRINWGAGYTHIPYRYSLFYFALDSLQGQPVDNLVVMDYRTFIDQISVFSYYPLNRKNRLEYGLGYTSYSFRIDSINNYYQYGYRIDRSEQKIKAPRSYSVYQTYVAYVGDNASWGFTSPMRGYRYRLQIEKEMGGIDVYGLLADYRKYFFRKPISFAFRGLSYNRIGPDANARYPLYLGYDYFIRGYSYYSFDRVPSSSEKAVSRNNLFGSKMLIFNSEIRLPFTGYKRLSVVNSKFLYTDFLVFFDGGLTWKTNHPFWNHRSGVSLDSWRKYDNRYIPVYSAGISLRINLFGMMTIEPYYALPFQRYLGRGIFGLVIAPGGW